jgi:hypothetical protein
MAVRAVRGRSIGPVSAVTPLRRSLLLICLVLLAAALSAPAASAACGSSAYAYAGVQGLQTTAGISAKLQVVSAPNVLGGHVAAWVGAGGPGAGADGRDEWIQAGFSGFPGTSMTSLYYEVVRPGEQAEYTLVESGLLVGTTRQVTVAEIAGRPNWWRVKVDGRAVSDPILLPGSDRRWQPMATGESWAGGSAVCNGFRYRFDGVRTASRAGAAWQPLTQTYGFQDDGYRVERPAPSSFIVSRAG